MTPKLGLLAMKLNRGIPSATVPENAASSMMTSYKEDVDRQKAAAIKVMDDKLIAAQSEIASLKAQLSEASKDTTRAVKDYGYRVDSLKEAHKAEMDTMAQKHYDSMGEMHNQMEAAKRECAHMCQEKIRIETELKGANNMITKLEQTIAKLQADLKAKPVVTPAEATRKPLKIRITQRDENGRIVELSEV